MNFKLVSTSENYFRNNVPNLVITFALTYHWYLFTWWSQVQTPLQQERSVVFIFLLDGSILAKVYQREGQAEQRDKRPFPCGKRTPFVPQHMSTEKPQTKTDRRMINEHCLLRSKVADYFHKPSGCIKILANLLTVSEVSNSKSLNKYFCVQTCVLDFSVCKCPALWYDTKHHRIKFTVYQPRQQSGLLFSTSQ